MEIGGDLGYNVEVSDVARAELYLADEMFLAGTAAELTPVREIDDLPLGPPGPITRDIQQTFEDVLHGRAERYLQRLDLVEVAAEAGRPSKVSSGAPVYRSNGRMTAPA